MSLDVQLLGRPALVRDGEPAYRFRSQKSWALLAYLLLAERPPARSTLAELLFAETEDPLGALRWNLAEVRRGLGEGATLEGDPVQLVLPPGSLVDVHLVTRGSWPDAVACASVGDELLDGITVRGAAGFESWLMTERQHLAAASEAVLHEAAQALMARGSLADAVSCARRVVESSPLDENNQALLIRLLRMSGDDAAAERQRAAYSRLLHDELGAVPGPVIESALAEPVRRPAPVTSAVSIEAILESGAEAVAAGATGAGLSSLRSAVELADLAGQRSLQVRARVVLAETLVHSLRGLDEEGLAALFDADRIAEQDGDTDAQAEIRAELGYVDFLRARYDRSERFLRDAVALDGTTSVTAKAMTYLGSVQMDRGDYGPGFASLDTAVGLAQSVHQPRREAFALTMIGRGHLLRGDLAEARPALERALELVEADRWLAFLPWPQAWLGEVELAIGDVAAAGAILDQAFARACQLGDPCWEGVSARGLALVAEAQGRTGDAFTLLADARARANRLADPYVWLDAHILDAQCELGRRHDHPGTSGWVDAMHRLASRTSMREMTVRALLHAAALGREGAANGAQLLSAEVDNPALARLVAAAGA